MQRVTRKSALYTLLGLMDIDGGPEKGWDWLIRIPKRLAKDGVTPPGDLHKECLHMHGFPLAQAIGEHACPIDTDRCYNAPAREIRNDDLSGTRVFRTFS